MEDIIGQGLRIGAKDIIYITKDMGAEEKEDDIIAQALVTEGGEALLNLDAGQAKQWISSCRIWDMTRSGPKSPWLGLP